MFNLPVLGICSYSSGTGKTSLLAALLPALATRGLRVSVIKQACAKFDIDLPGKDSYRLREAGASQVLLCSPDRWALLTEQEATTDDANILHLVQRLDPNLADVVLVEGFRNASIPKIEVFRQTCGKPLLAEHDHAIVAVASDTPVSMSIPVLNLNDADEIADFIVELLSLAGNSRVYIDSSIPVSLEVYS